MNDERAENPFDLVRIRLRLGHPDPIFAFAGWSLGVRGLRMSISRVHWGNRQRQPHMLSKCRAIRWKTGSRNSCNSFGRLGVSRFPVRRLSAIEGGTDRVEAKLDELLKPLDPERARRSSTGSMTIMVVDLRASRINTGLEENPWELLYL